MSTKTSDGSCGSSAVGGEGRAISDTAPSSSSRISGLKRLADIRRAEHERRQRIDAQRFAMTRQPINLHKEGCEEGDDMRYGGNVPTRASLSPAADVSSFARQQLLRLGQKHASFGDRQTSHLNRSSRSASMPLQISAPKVGTRDEGMDRYYLLARSMNTSKSPHHQVSNADSQASTAPIVSDDECSEQSCCTLSDVHERHGLQASMDHGSPSNTEDGSSLFAAFCKSQVLITRLEDEQIQRRKEAEEIRLQQQASRQRRMRLVIQFSKLIALCAAAFFFRRLAIDFHEHMRLYVSGRVGHARLMILATADSMHVRRREMATSASLAIERCILGAKAIPSEAYRKLMGADFVSLLVDGYFQGLAFYYNALEWVESLDLGVRSHYRAVMAWYASEPELYNSDLAEQHIAFAEGALQQVKSVVTLPILSDDYMWNMTFADESGIERSPIDGLGTATDLFWRQSIRKPFVKQEVPMMVRHLHRHMHSASCRDSICGADIVSPSFTGSTTNHHKRLRINVPRLQSILLPAELDSNLVASFIVQRSNPPKQAGSRSFQHPSADEKRKYYKSSLSIVDVQEDVFSEVKMADMAVHYMNHLWKQRRKRLNKHP